MATRLIAPQTAPPEDDAKLVKTSEAARMLGVSRTTIQKLFNTGMLQGVVTHGRHRRITLESIQKLTSTCLPPEATPQRLKVLIAEDNPVMQGLYRRQINASKLPIDLQFANDAWDALRLIQQAAPDVLITDLMMQPGDGWHLLRLVITDPRLASMGVAAVTALEPERVETQGELPPWLPVYFKPNHWPRLEGFLQAQVQQRLRAVWTAGDAPAEPRP
jgi:excisionase family DNA binding protein